MELMTLEAFGTLHVLMNSFRLRFGQHGVVYLMMGSIATAQIATLPRYGHSLQTGGWEQVDTGKRNTALN